MPTNFVKVDTKGSCLLCYDPCHDNNRGPSIPTTASSLGFKQLLSYVNVNTKQLFNCSEEILQWMEIRQDVDVQVSLCANCTAQTEKFNKLFQQYQLIRIQMDSVVGSIHTSMKRGNENPDKVHDYRKKMMTKSADFVNVSIAANLRNQTFKKCSTKLEKVLPRLVLQRVDCEAQRSKLKRRQRQTPASSLYCNICKQGFAHRYSFQRHRFNKHSARVIQEQCSTKVTLTQCKAAIDRILANISSDRAPEDQFECYYCPNKFKTMMSCKGHLMLSHADNIAAEVVLEQELSTPKPVTPVIPKRKYPFKVSTQTKKFKKGLPKLYSCEHCKYSSNLQSLIKSHELRSHTVEAVMPLLSRSTCKIKCGQGVKEIRSGLKKLGGQCPKCSRKLVNSTALWGHTLEIHFDEFVTDLKGNLGQDEVERESGEESMDESFQPVECLSMELNEDVGQWGSLWG